MSRYIDAEKFYAESVKWESEALTVLASLDPNADYTEYAKWSVILNERTSFKHDIMDAPKADVKEVTRCFECKYSHISEKDMILRCRLNGDRSADPYGYCDRGKEKEE